MTRDTDPDGPPVSRSTLPLVDAPDAVGEPVRDGQIAGVLLAAGTSSRFGEENKLLASLDGEPLVRHAGRTLAEADISPCIAVLGYDAERIREALDGLDLTFVTNPDYEQGQATSVRAAVDAIDDHASVDVAGAVFALGDMPFVDAATVGALVAAYRAGQGTALAAARDGQRGNPVLFDARHFDALAAVSGDVGGREILLESDDSALVETGDPGVHRDVDTPGDLDQIT